MNAISFSEHGKPLGWISKKLACDKAGIKMIHSVEIYLTESLSEKVRDNYHTVLLAKNMEGVKELNKLVSMSCQEDHFYYTNRISFDEFLNISPNIITTSACLASPLNKLPQDHPRYMELVDRYDYLEIQPHIHPEQIEYNKKLYDLSIKTGKPLIVGTDTHSSSKYKAECRDVLLSAKHKKYDDDGFDLTFKTYDELVSMFRKQNAIPEEEWMQALENTNVMADSIENFELDTSIKYPILYGSREADDEKFTETVERKFKEKIENGIIPKEQEKAFRDAIDEEMRVFRKLDMTGFMLSMSELLSWCRENDIPIGPSRGSVGGSRVAYVADIIDMNSEKWNTVFSRFCNEFRKEIGDVDLDCRYSDRAKIFQYIVDRFGEDKTARVASFGTIKDKGVIDDVGRHLAIKWEEAHPGNDSSANPWNLRSIDNIKNEYDKDPEKTKLKYGELFYYFDGLLGTKVSQSVHPAGMVISPISLVENYGTFDKDGDKCLFVDMEEIHEVGGAKYDFLPLKTVSVLKTTCDYLGKKYPRTHEINFEDEEVWEDMQKNLDCVFQFESPYSVECYKKFHPKSIFDMSLVTACIRPSGASYRDDLLARKIHKNPSEVIDDLLKNNLNYLVYQEDIIAFLQKICGLTGGQADLTRRGIARKKPEILQEMMQLILDGYCSKSDKSREEAESEAKEFLQIIEDASSYMFGYNHSIGYCLLGYMCGYYRHYYPLEFITSYLNNAANDDDIKTGTAYAQKIGVPVTMPKWGISRGDYFYDNEKRIIAKGLSSIKYMSQKVADQLYNLSHSKKYDRFVDLLYDLNSDTELDSRQLDILIKIDFFSDFGNQRELLRINDLFSDTFKKGEAKQIKKELVDGSPLAPIIQKYSVGSTKSGGVAKSYTLLDIKSILHEAEDLIKETHMPDLPDIIKVRNFYDMLGYLGYISGKQEDRRKLSVR